MEETLSVARDPSDEEFRRLIDRFRAMTNEVENLYRAGNTAVFQKNYSAARDIFERALARVKDMKALFTENIDLIRKFKYEVVIGDGIRAVENSIIAMLKALEGRIPNEHVNNAAINNTNSTLQTHNRTRQIVERQRTFDLTNRRDFEFVQKTMNQARRDAAVQSVLTETARLLNELKPVETYQRSKLDRATILKFRSWLMRQKVTPLARIPADVWNANSGYSYSPHMIRLMTEALQQAGVGLHEVARLSLRELEAILRARQYLYVAAKRGYFHPYEMELYRRLKELLMLRDQDIPRIFKFRLAERIARGMRVV
jgi:prophage DNA circulation protein